MKKRSKIYTKTGDKGVTTIVGGTKVKKNSKRLNAYGTTDELNAAIGVICSAEIPNELKEQLNIVQNKLFNIGARLASDKKGKTLTDKLSLTEDDILQLEKYIDSIDEELPSLTKFVLPGGSFAAAYCHMARTICRRAEREILMLHEQEPIQEEIIKYINRLSDYLFVLARKLTLLSGRTEKYWKQ